MAVCKNVVRYGVIAALVAGTAAVVAGPDRLGALLTQTRGQVQGAIDGHISDPVALRAQIRSLEGQYPGRIAEVRGDLAELREQQRQLTRELEVSHRVVALAQQDLEQIQDLIARGEAASTTGEGAIVRVVFNNERIDLKDAYAKAQRISQVQAAYSNRVNDIERDMGYLGTQEQRLSGLLDQLSTEHAEFQAQVWMMDRQIDSIARNDRLIKMMEKRQRTIDEQSRYSAHSLDQLAGRFADIRAKQEAKLETLGTPGTSLNYEDRAKMELDSKRATEGPAAGAMENFKPSSLKPLTRPSVIEIRPESRKAPAPEVEAPKEIALGTN